MLTKFHNKTIRQCHLKAAPESLHTQSGSRSTILVKIMIDPNDLSFQPGDHIGILPENRQDLVDGILENLTGKEDWDEIMQLQILRENHTSNGMHKF